jgi:hypothetical protein
MSASLQKFQRVARLGSAVAFSQSSPVGLRVRRVPRDPEAVDLRVVDPEDRIERRRDGRAHPRPGADGPVGGPDVDVHRTVGLAVEVALKPS